MNRVLLTGLVVVVLSMTLHGWAGPTRNPRTDRRHVVLVLGWAGSGDAGKGGHAVVSALQDRHGDWRFVNRLQPAAVARREVPAELAGLLKQSEPDLTGVYALRKALFGSLYDLRLGEVAAVVVLPGKRHVDREGAFAGREPADVFDETLKRVRGHRKTQHARYALFAPDGQVDSRLLPVAKDNGVDVLRASGDEGVAALDEFLVESLRDRPPPLYAEWFEQGIKHKPNPICTANRDRSPLWGRDGGEASAEGRRVLLDADSYPREPARFAEPPTVSREGNEWIIRFALDRADDVLVRAVDREGAIVRHLGCGVLGTNAPPPFAATNLAQTIRWDGLDAAGRPAPAGTRIQVGIGAVPRFERFLLHAPSQLMSSIIGLDVDPKGRVYVVMDSGGRYDMNILRLDREGRYVDMVYPSDPRALDAKLEDIYPFACSVDGMTVPTRPRPWPYYAYPRRLHGFPFRIDAKGRGWFAEVGTGLRSLASPPDAAWRVFGVPDLERFWFLQTMSILECFGAFAVDDKGHGYLAWRADRKVGFSGTHTSLNDPRWMGTIVKVDLATGKPAADFTYNGKSGLPAPRFSLGDGQTIAAGGLRRRNTPDPRVDNDHAFPDICAMDVDAEGRILVVDGYPRRLKIYAANGRWLGALSGVPIEGESVSFRDLYNVRAGAHGCYLLTSLVGRGKERFLIKCTGDPVQPDVAWLQPVDPHSLHLAVDDAADPVHLWVAGKGAGGRLTRYTDQGDGASAPLQAGGVRSGAIVQPGAMAVMAPDRLLVKDDARGVLVSCLFDGSDRHEVEIPHLRSLQADPHKGRVLVGTILRKHVCFDARLRKQPLELGPWSGHYGGQFLGSDPDGSLYVRDHRIGMKSRYYPKKGFNGVIRKYGPDGSVLEPELCLLWHSAGGAARDSQGNFYAMDLCLGKFQRVVHDFPFRTMKAAEYENMGWRRGEHTIRHQSEIGYLVKFPASGGVRNTETELWAHRGFSSIPGGGCHCIWPANLVAVDGADRIYGADVDHFHVKVLDANGNLIARVGRWGNAQTVPAAGEPAAGLGFSYIYSLSACGDRLFVADRVLRRIAVVKIDYRRLVEMEIAAGSNRGSE